MDNLTDLRTFLDVPELKLPIGGKVYVVEVCPADVWLTLQEIQSRAVQAIGEGRSSADIAEVSGGMSELEMVKLSLGDTFGHMLEGKVSGPELVHAGLTAYYWQLGQEEVATALWHSGGKAPAATKPPTRSPRTRTSTGAASTTRRRASTSGTSSRKGTAAKPAAKAAARRA